MKKNKFYYLYSLIKPYIFKEIIGLILIILSTVLSLLIPYITMIIIDVSIYNKNLDNLILNMSIFIGVLILAQLISTLTKLLFIKINENILFDIRNILLNKIIRKPILVYYSKQPGEIITMFLNELPIISGFITNSIVQIITNISILVVTAFIMLSLDIVISLFTLFIIIVVYFLLKINNPMFRENNNKILQVNSVVTNTLGEIINNIFIVKCMYTYEYCENIFSRILKKSIHTKFKLYNQEIRVTFLLSMIFILPSIMLLSYGGYLVIIGTMTIGNIVALNMYINKMFEPVKAISTINLNVQKILAAFTRFYNVVTKDNNYSLSKDLITLKYIKKGISLENIYFKYKDTDGYVLYNINLEIPLGKKILIKGSNGTGKTTLINIISGVLESNVKGTVKYDDINIKNINRSYLHNILGIIPQDNYLFNENIRNNICLGREYDDEKIYKLCYTLGFNNLFKGNLNLDTIISSKGTNISGGQKKQISILRGLIHNPQIIILDEPTTFIDEYTKEKFFNYLSLNCDNKIVLVISHEAIDKVDFDEILEFNKCKYGNEIAVTS